MPEGRFIVAGDEGETVLVATVIGALPARGLIRGRKPRKQEEGKAAETALLRATHARAERFDDEKAAGRWLGKAVDDEAVIDAAFDVFNGALAAHRLSSGNPLIGETDAASALAVRVGYGSPDEIAGGNWTKAVQLPPERRKRMRPTIADIQPAQRMAAILSGREIPDEWEEHTLRAHVDLDTGRLEACAGELRAALEGFDRNPPDFAANINERAAAELDSARETLAASSPDREDLAAAVEIFGRLQRRRRRPPVD